MHEPTPALAQGSLHNAVFVVRRNGTCCGAGKGKSKHQIKKGSLRSPFDAIGDRVSDDDHARGRGHANHRRRRSRHPARQHSGRRCNSRNSRRTGRYSRSHRNNSALGRRRLRRPVQRVLLRACGSAEETPENEPRSAPLRGFAAFTSSITKIFWNQTGSAAARLTRRRAAAFPARLRPRASRR